MRRVVWVCLCGVVAVPALGQLRVASWNVTNYSSGRVSAFETAIYGTFQGRSLAPDVLIGQEFLSASGVNNFLNILNNAPGSAGDWAAAPFVNGNDTDNAFFYRTSKVQFLGSTVVATGGFPPNHPRDVNRYDIRPIGYDGAAATIACYSSHMKAGSGNDDQARRLLEAQRIRDDAEALPADWNFLIGADFNIQSSGQAAYIELTGAAGNNDGRFFDPIRTPGGWNNNFGFRFVHTQDPSGAGGMDDRHDQILVSAELVDADGMDYDGNSNVPYSNSTWNDPNHSYRAWGNDGTTYNSSLRIANNAMVGAVIAQALVDTAQGGGHLPVVLDLLAPPMIDSDVVLDFGTVDVGAPALQILSVSNPADVALWTAAGIAELQYSLVSTDPAFFAPIGSFGVFADEPANTHAIILDTSTEGSFSGTIEIASNSPEDPVRIVTVTGVVQAKGALLGDLNCDGIVGVSDIGPFVLALTDPAGYDMMFPDCDINNGDINQDDFVGVGDIGAFVALLTGG